MKVELNSKMVKEVLNLEYLKTTVAANRGVKTDVSYRLNEGCKLLTSTKHIIRKK